MDGNGRWAKKRGLPRTAGHAAGSKKFKEIARYCNKIGIKYLTVYAFSTENWRRPKEEVDAIMNIFRDYLKDSANFKKENIKLEFLGDRSGMPQDIAQLMAQAEYDSKDATGFKCYMAINYGGRDEIIRAVKAFASDVQVLLYVYFPIFKSRESYAECLSGNKALFLILACEKRIKFTEYLSLDRHITHKSLSVVEGNSLVDKLEEIKSERIVLYIFRYGEMRLDLTREFNSKRSFVIVLFIAYHTAYAVYDLICRINTRHVKRLGNELNVSEAKALILD
jgi:hypothetical protein